MKLNSEQQNAVTRGDGHSLVLAGAGTGKTRVIVERMAYLVGEKGVDPRNILGLTFTNKAASEMRERIAARLGLDRIGIWLGTFHAFGAYLLRREADRLGRKRNFIVYDQADQLALMKQLVKALPADSASVSPRDALDWIGRLKQKGRGSEVLPDDASPIDRTYEVLWQRYHQALERNGAVDFDDLLVLPMHLLAEHSEVRERYSGRYLYVHVDEYQDTSFVQYRLAKLLSSVHGNLFVVGDEDQSIYSWRGATIRNILDFEEDFPEAKVFRLEENYRSSGRILDAANAVVAHNEHRLGKTLWTSNPAGEPVRFYLAKDEEDEARFVVDDLVERGIAPANAAVLFRTNNQSRLMEEVLRRKGMGYVVVGMIEFYNRKEVKDLLAYLRLLVNPDDDVALRRVLNVPPRGVGASTLAHLEEYAAARNIPMFRVLHQIEGDQTLAVRARQSIADFVAFMDETSMFSAGHSVQEAIERILERTQYKDYVERTYEDDRRTRLEAIDDLVASCASYDKRSGKSVTDFLQELALVSDVDAWDPATPVLTLMTCHSAKGLEFDYVYLIGLEEGILPHASTLDNEEEVEEERRLCYVAMTRARKGVTLAAAQSRLRYGVRSQMEVSRFIDELPRSLISMVGPVDASVQAGTRPSQKAQGVSPAKFKMGVRVWHAKFGKGTVMYTKGTGSKLRARIRFGSGFARDFLVSQAPLEIVEGDRG